MTCSQTKWQRVSRNRRCPVCDKPDWCLFAGDPRNPTVAICQRIESEKKCGDAGWLHRLRDDDRWRPGRRRTVVVSIAQTTDAAQGHIDRQVDKFCEAVDAEALERLADELGLTQENLHRLQVGWSAEHRAWTFPMFDAAGNVQGIRLRFQNGRKLSVAGGHEGLFIPSDLDAGGRVLIAEGPTDTAALLDLGFSVIGRPSCTGGVKLVIEFFQKHNPAEAVIVADGDGPGRHGADSLAVVLVAYCQTVRIIAPPEGINDAREWKRAGATRQDIEEVIETTKVRRLPIATERKGEEKR